MPPSHLNCNYLIGIDQKQFDVHGGSISFSSTAASYHFFEQLILAKDNLSAIRATQPANMTHSATVIDKDLSDLTQKLESPQSDIIADAMAKIAQRIEPNDPNETDNDSRTYREKTINCGCGHLIIQIMSKWSQNASIMYIGCVILINLTVEDTGFARTGEETNGIKVVADMIENPKFHNQEMLGVAFQVLANYAAKAENRDYLNRINIGDAICNGMSVLRSFNSTQKKGTKVLNNLLYWNTHLRFNKNAPNCVQGAIKIALAVLQHIQWNDNDDNRPMSALKTIRRNIDLSILPYREMHVLDEKMLGDIVRLVLFTMNNNKDEQAIQTMGCEIMCNIWRFDNVDTKVRAAMDENNADAILRYAYHHYHIEDAKNFVLQKLWRHKA